MPVVNPEKLATLQQNADDVRNVSRKVSNNTTKYNKSGFTNDILDMYFGSCCRYSPSCLKA